MRTDMLYWAYTCHHFRVCVDGDVVLTLQFVAEVYESGAELVRDELHFEQGATMTTIDGHTPRTGDSADVDMELETPKVVWPELEEYSIAIQKLVWSIHTTVA